MQHLACIPNRILIVCSSTQAIIVYGLCKLNSRELAAQSRSLKCAHFARLTSVEWYFRYQPDTPQSGNNGHCEGADAAAVAAVAAATSIWKLYQYKYFNLFRFKAHARMRMHYIGRVVLF